ncbi:hypothetical protein GN760_08520 [Campylobacter coli]|nr:hypothetical protein [Campylobacter coli]ECC0152144.1 hypothetical protein [Campylobacter jejuni]EAH5626907.1 hypothetical protein [Campylobacter coli]EAH8133634.1 hypothetical protein [Campylobacter coli]EAI0187114.1 hypothetical protein [Campylobacter coli]
MHYLKVRKNGAYFEARICEQKGKDNATQKEIYIQKNKNLIIEGFNASGKSSIYHKFLEKAQQIYKLDIIFIKHSDSMSDIFFNNKISKDELEGEFCTAAKEQALIRKAKGKLLLIDGIDKFTGKKLELTKALLLQVKKFIITTSAEASINPTLRRIANKKGEAQIIELSSVASKDATNYLFIVFICVITLLGFYEIALLITAGRLAMRGVKVW